jgi:hypothetical protein
MLGGGTMQFGRVVEKQSRVNIVFDVEAAQL